MTPHRLSLNGSDWSLKDFLGEDWRWRDSHLPATRDRRGWRPAAVPGSVQNDVWQAGEIPSPYFELNTRLIEWTAARTWVYRKSFDVPAEREGQRAHLIFNGVDYEAQFWLNGVLLGTHVGMHTPAVFPVDAVLRYGAENELAVVIEAAPLEQPQVGRTSKVRTHKSRMNYGWDFSPRVVHQGIWDDVWVDFTGEARLTNVFVRPTLADDLQQAHVSVAVSLDVDTPLDVEVRVRILRDGVVAEAKASASLEPGVAVVNASVVLLEPDLWWPNGYGEQALYLADVDVSVDGAVSDTQTVTFGIRRLRFLPNDTTDETALPYTLEVNGRRIYITGWNWVPIDVLYGVPHQEKMLRLLTLARRAHVVLLRVWGGGLIEREAFYDLCDGLGLLVWQEFTQSSSGIDNVPSHDPEWVEALRAEAERVVPLRRNHASLALWCGGNELQGEIERPLDDTHPALAALRDVVRRLDPDRAWLPTSSTGRFFSNLLEHIASDPLGLHDVHGPWEHQGLVAQCVLYNSGTSLLHSEFGVEGITNPRALDAVIAPEHQWPITLDNPYWRHLSSWWVKAALWREVFGEMPDVATTVRALQFLQADGLRYAVEANRRRQWRCSGTLPWQFNEPYPNPACTSAVDYFGVPKPVYYAVARAYAPLTITAAFPTQAWADCETFEAVVSATWNGLEPLEDMTLNARLVEADGSEILTYRDPVALHANRTTPLTTLTCPIASVRGPIFFLDLALQRADGSVAAANRYLYTLGADMAPLFHEPTTALDVRRDAGATDWRLTITNAGQHTALFVWLEDQAPLEVVGTALFSDNHFCLFPGEARTIDASWATVPTTEGIQVRAWNAASQRLMRDQHR